MSNDEPSGQESDEPTDVTELRAQWEAFEFRVPAPGRVRVENVSYGGESDEHVYVVSVEDGATTECTCPGDEFHCGPGEQCKHRHAVEDQPAVLLAASTSDEERAATDADPTGGRAIATDGGERR